MTTATITRYTEATAIGTPSIDRENGVIRNVRILGPESRNGRKYLREAVEAATPLYEASKVYLNHGKEVVRQVADRWGQLINVRTQEDGGLAGDLKFNRKHKDTEAILEAIEQFNDFGLSHDIEATVTRDEQGNAVVDKIVAVNSVDLVEKPATTSNLFEHEAPTMKRRKLLTVLREHRDTVPEAGVILKNIAEMADDPKMEMAHASMMDAEAEMAGEPEPGDAVKAGIRSAIMAILDQDGEVSDMLAKIRALLQAEAKATGSSATEEGNSPPTDDDAEDDSEDDEMKEQIQALTDEVNRLKEEKAALQDKQACEQLLESLNREVTDIRVRALQAITGDDQEESRKALVESWAERKADAYRPQQSEPRYRRVSEGEGTTPSFDDVKKRLLKTS